jgi:hypothetical protein
MSYPSVAHAASDSFLPFSKGDRTQSAIAPLLGASGLSTRVNVASRMARDQWRQEELFEDKQLYLAVRACVRARGRDECPCRH